MTDGNFSISCLECCVSLKDPRIRTRDPTRGLCILFSVVFTPPPSSHRGSVRLQPAISLLLDNTVSRVRACLSIRLERFRGNYKEDERLPSSMPGPKDLLYTGFIASIEFDLILHQSRWPLSRVQLACGCVIVFACRVTLINSILPLNVYESIE